jgi:hypothetical protein
MNYTSLIENSIELSNYFSRKLILRRKYREKRAIDKLVKNAKNTLQMYPISPLLTQSNIPQTTAPSSCHTKSILYIFSPYPTGSPYALYPTIYPAIYDIPYPSMSPVMYYIPRPSSCPTTVPTVYPTIVPTIVPTNTPTYPYHNDSANNIIQYSNNNYNTPIFIIATSVGSLIFCVILIYVYKNYTTNKYKLQKIQKNALKREPYSLNDVHIDYNREFKYS